jgi:hypothetical protein
MSSAFKLGRRPARLDPRTVRLAPYLKALDPAPPAHSWLSGIRDWGMMANDQLGDCTIAGIGHALQVWSAATGPQLRCTDDQVVFYYSQWAGYDPKRPSTDQGAVELDILNQWRKSDDGFMGEQLVAYADPDPRNAEHVRQAIYRFGLLYVGIGLPLTAQEQDIWDYVPNTDDNRPWSWGGHCVVVPRYDEHYLYCVTWGEVKRMTWEFWRRYCDESHALLSRMWLERAGADYHFIGDLQQELAEVTR